MTDEPKHPSPRSDLAEAVRGRSSPAWLAFDRTWAELRGKFADMPPDELEALINEAVTATRRKRDRLPRGGGS